MSDEETTNEETSDKLVNIKRENYHTARTRVAANPLTMATLLLTQPRA